MGLRDEIEEVRCPVCGYPNVERYCSDCGHDLHSSDEDLIEKLAEALARRMKKK